MAAEMRVVSGVLLLATLQLLGTEEHSPLSGAQKVKPWININTDAGLHVVIIECCKHIYTIALSMCVRVHIQESSSLVDSYLSRTY